MLEYVKRNSKQYGDIMNEGFTKLNREQFRYFEDWLSKHLEELYENKIAYEVRWQGKDFYVKLCDESIYTIIRCC